MALLATVAPWLPASRAGTEAGRQGLDVNGMVVATSVCSLKDDSLKSDALDTVVVIESKAEDLSVAVLGRLAKALRPGGHMAIRPTVGTVQADLGC